MPGFYTELVQVLVKYTAIQINSHKKISKITFHKGSLQNFHSQKSVLPKFFSIVSIRVLFSNLVFEFLNFLAHRKTCRLSTKCTKGDSSILLMPRTEQLLEIPLRENDFRKVDKFYHGVSPQGYICNRFFSLNTEIYIYFCQKCF